MGSCRIRSIRFWIQLVLLLCGSAAIEAQWVDLVNAKGVRIHGRVLAVEGNFVDIEREDGRVFRHTPIDLYDAPTQAYIRDWAQANEVIPDNALAIEIEKRRLAGEETNTESTHIERESVVFTVETRNRASRSLSGLEIRYQILIWDDDHGTAKDREIEVTRVTGKRPLASLASGERFSFTTDPLVTEAGGLRDDWTYTDSSLKNRAEDEIKGILVRIYRNDTLVAQASYPDGLFSRYEWKR